MLELMLPIGLFALLAKNFICIMHVEDSTAGNRDHKLSFDRVGHRKSGGGEFRNEGTFLVNGGVQIALDSFGGGRFVNAANMTVAQWHDVIDTNLTGVFYCCSAALPHLRARNGGYIINISSLAGKNNFVGGSAYCASKAGLNAFSEALMMEVRQDGIRVSTVMPGSVATEFMGRAPDARDGWKLTSDDVAQVVVDLVAHNPRSLPSRVEIRPSMPK